MPIHSKKTGRPQRSPDPVESEERSYESNDVRGSEFNVAALRSAQGAATAGGARLVRGALPGVDSRRSNAKVPARKSGKHVHPHGNQLLGYGGEYRQSRIDQ